MKLYFHGLFVLLLAATFIAQVVATKSIFAVDPATSGAYRIIFLDVPVDAAWDDANISLPGRVTFNQDGNSLLYVSPVEALNSSARVQLYILPIETINQANLVNPETGQNFESLTEADLVPLGLQAPFGIIHPVREGSLLEEFPIVEGGAETQGEDALQEVQQQMESQPQSTSFQERQEQKTSWALFLLPAALILILIFYIFWMRRKPVV